MFVMYENEFNEALNRNRRFGLSVPDIVKPNVGRFITDKACAELPFFVKDKGLTQEEEVVLQCISFNFRLKEILSEYFKSPLYYTIGHVKINNDSMFEQSEKSLFTMLKNGITSPSINLHVWLTLPSMEILDYTLQTTYGRVNNDPRLIGNVIAQHPNDFTKSMSFHPMIIGEEFMQKIGAMQFIKF
jgi:hypothetical protein